MQLKKLIAMSALCLAIPLAVQADDLSDGVTAFQKQNYRDAMAKLKPLADKGDSKALYFTALMHYYGQEGVVPENNEVAFANMLKAAEKSYADAQYMIGHFYIFGHGVPASEMDADRKGVEWYFKAAAQNHAEALYSLGLMFQAGKGVILSNEEAAKYYEMAAKQGHVPAQKALKELQEYEKALAAARKAPPKPLPPPAVYKKKQ
jgi:TPR repeat protein